MEALRDMEPFGRLNIPIPPVSDSTASYEATSWEKLIKTWKISMFLTFPGTHVPVDMPTVSLLSSNVPSDEEERISFMKLTEQAFEFWKNPEEDIYQDYLPETKK